MDKVVSFHRKEHKVLYLLSGGNYNCIAQQWDPILSFYVRVLEAFDSYFLLLHRVLRTFPGYSTLAVNTSF